MSRNNEWGQPIGPELPGFRLPPAPPRVAFGGPRVQLVPLDAQVHSGALWRALGPVHPSHWTYLPYGPFENEGAFRGFIERSAHGTDPLFFCIVDRAAAAPVGLASYLRLQREHGVIEVGHLNYAPALAHSAAATEAMHLMMQRAFSLGYRRYEWKCDALHARSRAAAVRLGFRFEGIFRQAIVYKGRSRDTAWYSVIDRDWPALERAQRAWLAPDNFDAEGRQRTRLSELTRALAEGDAADA
jgi:RimJ/RimL family protein N-acetyltransferase